MKRDDREVCTAVAKDKGDVRAAPAARLGGRGLGTPASHAGAVCVGGGALRGRRGALRRYSLARAALEGADPTLVAVVVLEDPRHPLLALEPPRLLGRHKDALRLLLEHVRLCAHGGRKARLARADEREVNLLAHALRRLDVRAVRAVVDVHRVKAGGVRDRAAVDALAVLLGEPPDGSWVLAVQLDRLHELVRRRGIHHAVAERAELHQVVPPPCLGRRC